ncbi:hypothetical protein [Alloyangia pacifica]|uniref:Uncharacterized protein n=1 Tax=Alloyangia pacifica TaxID=311180 RepID=A0A1I6SRX2_9RHOB|nr:hypothetical protein [Alloyangia pacifica]SDG86330.1 hypothetical protein SAMN04488245_10515 [Alloyangia pacifica]SFS79657.1 hypothetical protein SAMN04488050_10515 [Alloyangia pacifica]
MRVFAAERGGDQTSQQRVDPSVAVADILPGQLDDVGGQLLFVFPAFWRFAQSGATPNEH